MANARMDAWQSPEEREIDRKRAELERLRTRLAARQAALVSYQYELGQVRTRYLRGVGVLLAERDAVEADLAAWLARTAGVGQARLAWAQARADRSAQEALAPEPDRTAEDRADIRQLYRLVAKRLHPDLAADGRQRARLTALMSEANAAYARRDVANLRRLLDWEPDEAALPGTAGELVRLIREIARVAALADEVEARWVEAEASDEATLLREMQRAAADGRDLLAELTARAEAEVVAAVERLRLAGRWRAHGDG